MKFEPRFIVFTASSLLLVALACNFVSVIPNPPAAEPITNQSDTPAPPVPQDNAPAPNPPSGDARQALIDAFTKLTTAYPFRETETSTASYTDVTTVRTVEYASASEWHTTWTAGAQSGEVISTGGKMYWYSNGSWQDVTEAPSEAESQFEAENLANFIGQALTNVQYLGAENLNGIQTYAYTFDLQLPDTSGNGKAWIGVADGLPHQAQAQLNTGGVTLNTLLVYEYGIMANIQAPAQ